MRVTVLLAVHNGLPYLREAVQSVLDQTFDDFELLVVDDASTDGSAEWVAALGDERIRVLRNETNIGQVPSLNLGLREARGEIVARQDADDVWHPRRLELQVEALDREPSVAVVGSWLTLIDDDGLPLGDIDGEIDDRVDFVYWTLRQWVLIAHSAAAFRLAPVLELGGYDESLGPAEDKDLFRRLLLAGWDARIVRERLIRYRVHGEQLSQTQSERQRRHDAQSQEAMIAELAPGAPVRFLRLLLAGDNAAWAEPPCDVAAALDALLAGTVARIGLTVDEAARLRARVAERVAAVALGGWRAPAESTWRQTAPDALAWAGDRRASLFPVVRTTAPVLRVVQRSAGAVAVRVARTPALATVRGVLRRHPALRRAYAKIVRH